MPGRLIEDKMTSFQTELRDITICSDLSGLHRNSDRPAFYAAYIAVADSALPLKGAAHRASRHDADAVKPVMINEHCQSELWRLQGMNELAAALPENQFCVPSSRSHLSANDCRRNLTDFQETSQWLAGEDAWAKIIESMTGRSAAFLSFTAGFRWQMLVDMNFIIKVHSAGDRSKRTVLINTTPYCASVEKACIKLHVPVLSITDNSINHSYTSLSIRNKLLLETNVCVALSCFKFLSVLEVFFAARTGRMVLALLAVRSLPTSPLSRIRRL